MTHHPPWGSTDTQFSHIRRFYRNSVTINFLSNNAANYNTVILDNSLLQTVTIPEAAHIQLRRGPPDDEQG